MAAGKSFCRECGASDDAGWDDDQSGFVDGYAAEDDFDYEAFLEREFPGQTPSQPPSLARLSWVIIAILLVLAIIMLTVL